MAEDRFEERSYDERRGLDRGPFYPTALDEGLSGWIILLKDQLRRTLYTHAEVDSILTALGFLRAYDRKEDRAEEYERKADGEAGPKSHAESRGESPLFDTLYSILAQAMARLRALREQVREDLVAVELTLLPGCTYEELSRPLYHSPEEAFTPEHGVVLPRPMDDEHKTLAKRYAAALRVLVCTSLDDAYQCLFEDLPAFVKEHLPGFEGEFTRYLEKFKKLFGKDASRQSQRAIYWVRVVLILQAQPYCQPARVDAWLERRLTQVHAEGLIPESPEVTHRLDAEFDIQLHDWIKITKSDGRLDELFSQMYNVWDRDNQEPLVKQEALCDPSSKARVTLAHFIILWAEACWRQRSKRVLGRVARYRGGDVPDVDRGILNPIHRDLFEKVARYHIEFEEVFSALRGVIQSIQQREALLAPSFPRAAHIYRHAGQQLDMALRALLSDAAEQGREVLKRLGRGNDTPVIAIDVSFECAFVSKTHLITTNVSAGKSVRAVMITVPFFWRESPRYFANVVHEIAHAYVDAAEIADLFISDDDWPDVRGRWNDGDVADILRLTGSDLVELWVENGYELGPDDAAQFVMELLADFVALLVVGPHYLYSLLYTTIGVCDLPSVAGLARPATMNPFVRISALIDIVHVLWPDLFSAQDENPNAIGFWRENRLRPVESISRAYFQLIEEPESSNDYDPFRVNVLREESRILADGFKQLVSQVESTRRLWPTFSLVANPKNVPAGQTLDEEQVRAFHLGSHVGALMRAALDKMPGALLPGTPKLKGSDCQWHFVSVRGGTVDKFLYGNMLHFLWNSVLKRYPEATERFIAASRDQGIEGIIDDLRRNPGAAASLEKLKELRRKRRRALEFALWTRTPEVRIMMNLLVEHRSKLENATAMAEIDVGPTSRPPPAKSAIQEGDVVTLVQVDAFWLDADGRSSKRIVDTVWDQILEENRDWHPAWVIGDHDFEFLRLRVRGAERLDRLSSSLFEWIPANLRYCTLRCVDYVVLGNQLSNAEAQELGAILLVRFHAPQAVKEICKVIEDNGCCVELMMLSQVNWAQYAIRIGFDSFQDVARLCDRLEKRFGICYRTLNLLYRPKQRNGTDVSGAAMQSPAMEESEKREALWRQFSWTNDTDSRAEFRVGLASRFRCQRSPKAPEKSRTTTNPSALRKKFSHYKQTSGPVRVTLYPTTGNEDLELWVELWTPKRPFDMRQEQKEQQKEWQEKEKVWNTGILRIYQELVQEVACESNAFDIRTTVLLPEPPEATG
jgi:hypothetical protein